MQERFVYFDVVKVYNVFSAESQKEIRLFKSECSHVFAIL